MNQTTINPEQCSQSAGNRFTDMSDSILPSKLKPPSKIPRRSAFTFKSLQQEQPPYSLNKILKIINSVLDSKQANETVTVRQSCAIYSGNGRVVKAHTKSFRLFTTPSPSIRVKRTSVSVVANKEKMIKSELTHNINSNRFRRDQHSPPVSSHHNYESVSKNQIKPKSSNTKSFELKNAKNANTLRPLTATIRKEVKVPNVSYHESFCIINCLLVHNDH